MNTQNQWFAPRGIEREKNVYFQARTAFEIEKIPAHYEIKIAAESWYRLWCNGHEVATGPARGSKTLTFFDSFDLAPFLQRGDNTLQVLAGSANIPTFKIAPIRPALWVELEGKNLSWQTARDESFAHETALFNFQTGFCEWRDLRADVLHWDAPEFFTLEKELLPRDCAPFVVTEYSAPDVTFPIELNAGEKHVFDFGRMIIGFAELQIESEAGTQIEIGYGEHLKNGHVQTHLPNEVHTYADRFIARDGLQVLPSTVQERGFRYLQIASEAPLKVLAVRAFDRRHPLAPPRFSCDDENLNRLWRMAHHTVSSNATDALTDCPWREQALWLNDMVVNALFWLEAGGDPQLVVRCLNLALSERNADGLIYGVTPSGDREEIVFLATNAWTALVLHDLSRYDFSAAQVLLPRIVEVLESLAKFEDADGLLIGPEKYWNFLDWSFEVAGWLPNGRAMGSVNWFYVLALQAMADLQRKAGAEYSAWQQRAARTASALEARFWDESRQCYREFEDEEKASELSQALALLALPQLPNRDANRLQVLCAHLERDGDDLFKPELYMMHFVLRALIENGKHKAALARLHRYWGSIVESDSVALWEANVHQHGGDAFDGAGSLCHAFSCAPLWALPRLKKTHLSAGTIPE